MPELGILAVDGAFGPRTEATVKTYQRSFELPVTGVVGQRTWDSLPPVRSESPLCAQVPKSVNGGGEPNCVDWGMEPILIRAWGFKPSHKAVVREIAPDGSEVLLNIPVREFGLGFLWDTSTAHQYGVWTYVVKNVTTGATSVINIRVVP
jgi:hypothetical protein